MPWSKPETSSYTDQAHVHWYKKNHWQARRVRTVCNKREIYVWFPPDDTHTTGLVDEESAEKSAKKRGRHRLSSETPYTWLSMLTAWHHLRDRGAPMEPAEKFTLDHFMDRFFADWGRAASILKVMATMDQSAIMQHFEIEKLHARTRTAVQRARADYMASQAAREPDPLAED